MAGHSIRAALSSASGASYVSAARRLHALKTDDAYCLLEMRHSGRFALFCDFDKPLMSKSATSQLYSMPSVTYGELFDFFGHDRHPEVDSVLLDLVGESREEPLFAWNMLTSVDEEVKNSIEERFQSEFVNFRKALFAAEDTESLRSMAKGYAMLNWHRNNVYSPYSGSNTTKNVAGSERKCQKTGRTHYPSMAPVSIVLVVDRIADACILARQPVFSTFMYSCLAGFAEMGETLEETVKREVAEEVGVAIKTVQYLKSQHWPFPASSLMLGCIAEVDNEFSVIDVDKAELEDARWFSRQQVQTALEKSLNPRLPTRRSPDPASPEIQYSKENLLDNLYVPPPNAIAHQLICHWLQNS